MSLPPILQVLPSLVAGGVERGTLEIAEAIIAAGGRALVASAGGPLVGPLERLGATHVTLPLRTKAPWGILRNAGALARLAAAEGVGIIHARSRAPAWSAMLAARRAGAHFVTTYHGTYNEGVPGKRLYNSVMARGERVIAISHFIAAHIRERHGTDPARIRIIPRGVDPRSFDPALVPPGRLAALRAEWRLPEGRPVLMLPSRITRWKGQGVLLRAMARLPGATVAVLVGDGGRYRRELEAEAARLGLGDRLRFAGHVEDVPAALMLADLVLHCSTEPEAFGRTVIEAQAMARPVIAADLGGPRETVMQNETGWRVPPGDPEALARAIGHALGLPPDRRAAIGEAARAHVLAHYTTAAMQQATLAVYRELA
ncbi:glycosyltransferase family 4 protein [Belnapia sp. T18]|uniref:Glycosyltransferase family 4 protein n=1 Tax=Belnapia arida TaxID=2804533 RepID=A0ABS1U1N9_9PROT|nr:glycosyltransferase family 4 protein [Belnapia arida]MBL6078582.1 glycosyltransferase family 4 protein [Belnapia arida]